MNWQLALPEIFLSCAAMAILMYGVFARPDRSFVMSSMFSVGALLLTAMLVLSGTPGTGYNGLFAVDAYSHFAKLLILVAVGLGVVMSLDYAEHANMQRFEFPVLMLLAAVGMMLMVSATSLMTLYLGLELMSLSIYVLAAFAREGGQHVDRQAHQLEAEIEGHEAGGGDHQHHADGGEQHQHREFEALHVGVLGVVERHHHAEADGNQDQQLGEVAVGIDGEEAVVAGAGRAAEHQHGGEQQRADREHGGHDEAAVRPGEDAVHQDRHGGAGEEDLREGELPVHGAITPASLEVLASAATCFSTIACTEASQNTVKLEG